MGSLDLQELIAHADQILSRIGEENPAFDLSSESLGPVQVDFISRSTFSGMGRSKVCSESPRT